MNDEQPNTDQQPEDLRIHFSAERTLIGWMRTGLALLGFGFVVARFDLFQREIAAAGQVAAPWHSTGWSLGIGAALIGRGVVVSLRASFEYYSFVRLIKQRRTYTPRTAMLAVIVIVILALLGIVMALYLILVSQ